MKLRTAVIFGAFVALGIHSAHAQHWGYTGEAGPQHWSKLDQKYAMCGIGRNQSPINLAGFVKADLKPLRLSYKPGAADIVNNGHSVQIAYAPGSSQTVDGRTFELKQFHFHAPSENHINGKSFPLEGHLVHEDKDGNLAVVAVLYREGAANSLLEKLWSAIPGKEGEKAPLPQGLDVARLLPKSRDYYRFNGSLTTPPCSEGVWWLVMKEQPTVSKAQVERLTKALGFANNRPIQPTYARPVLR